MKTICALFLLGTIATLFHTRVAVAQAPTQPDAEKPRVDCEELPAVAAKLANAEKTLQDWPNLAHIQEWRQAEKKRSQKSRRETCQSGSPRESERRMDRQQITEDGR